MNYFFNLIGRYIIALIRTIGYIIEGLFSLSDRKIYYKKFTKQTYISKKQVVSGGIAKQKGDKFEQYIVKKFDNKLFILSFSIPSLIAVFFGVLAYQTDNENDSLKLQNKTLNENYNQLKRSFLLTSDSLKIERQKAENKLQELKAKKAFYINQNLKTE